MKYSLVPYLAFLLLGACSKDKEAQPEYAESADWYVLKAPDTRAIQAVSGDIDGTLVVTTTFNIYQTKDRGKTWQKSNYAANLGVMGFSTVQDTLLAMTAKLGAGLPDNSDYAAQPSFASLDQGATWRPYLDRRYGTTELRVCLNRVAAPSGTEYSIDYLLTPTSPNSGTSYVETTGISTSTGKQLTLPQSHTITSLSFDAKSRLYVTASGALCGQRDKYAFCGTPNGVLYVSKKPQL